MSSFSVRMAGLLDKRLSFLQLIPADSFVPSSVRTSKLPLDRLPKMNPFRLSGYTDMDNQVPK
jgi:hypothetical protein